MYFAVQQKRWFGQLVPSLAVVMALAWGGCTLDFPIEWLEGECGDGYVGQGEQCDDGDTNSGDGCSATCTEEDGFDCVGVPSVCTTTCGDGVTAGVEQCDDGNTVPNDGCDENCQTELEGCGDGEIQSADGESCDDGNSTAFDGCNDLCQIEPGWSCNGAPSVCVEICGDSIVVGAEALQEGCDDGNNVDGDGCDFQCQVEPGYICVGEPSVCQTGCGDGMVAGIEVCDDGNTAPNDGCDATCQVEDGFTCDGASPTVCAAICGDGLMLGAETCDDGNTAPFDGCDGACVEESGWTCDASPVNCSEICGDTLIVGDEVCDDGNTSSCDGCRGDCLANETGCGDGAVCGTEACDDGDNSDGDGCSSACVVEAGWTCLGEPSVCTVPCNRPEALVLQCGCQAGDKCTIDSGNIQCGSAGALAAYQDCVLDSECEAGTWCELLPSETNPTCIPFCEIHSDCPGTAMCFYVYDPGPWSIGLCRAEDACDPTLVNPPTCAGGEACYMAAVGTYCESPGTVLIGQSCYSSGTFSCEPSASCISTGPTTAVCYEICSWPGGSCDTGGTTCQFNGDPDWGLCDT